jgi:hypothetical protein
MGLAFRIFMLEKKPERKAGMAEAAPHYHGHRQRLRALPRRRRRSALRL